MELGRALEQITSEGKLHELQSLYKKSKFFRTLIENSMHRVCATPSFSLTSYMAVDPKFGSFWSSMNEAFERTAEWGSEKPVVSQNY